MSDRGGTRVYNRMNLAHDTALSDASFHGLPGDMTHAPALDPSSSIHLLGRMDTRAARALVDLGIKTVGELEALLARPDAASSSVLGRRSHELLTEQLERVRALGVSRAVFGTEQVPDTATGLLSAYLARLDEPRERDIFRRRFREGLTLQATADLDPAKVCRERIRQIESKSLARDRGAWGAAAARLLAPVEALVNLCGGLVPPEACFSACGATSAGELEFLVKLVGEECTLAVVQVGGATVVATDRRAAVVERRALVRSALDEALGACATRERAREVLREFGLQLPLPLEEALLRDFFWVELQGTAAYSSRRRVQALWVEALRSLGGTASARQVSERMAELNPDERFLSPRNAVAHFMRSPEVFSQGRDRWCHVEHLGVDRAELERLARACIAVLPKDPEGAIVPALLAHAGEVLPPGINAYVVRDALLQTGEVRSWRNVLQVAFRDSEARRVSLSDRLLDGARARPQPFSAGELVEEVAEASGSLEISVWMRLHAMPELLGLGGGIYLAWEGHFASQEALAAEQQRLAALMPADRVVTARELAALAAPGCPVPGLYGDVRVAFGMARAAGLGATSRAGGLLWNPTLGRTPWEALSSSRGFSLPPPTRTRELRGWLLRHLGVDDESLPWVLVQQARDAGALAQPAVEGSSAGTS